MPDERVAFFPNASTRSGKSRNLQVAIASEIKARNVALRIVHTNTTAEMREAIASAANSGERVVVAGGDGTVHQAVNALAGGSAASGAAANSAAANNAAANNATANSKAVLGVVACGTGNDFARCMGLPVLSTQRSRLASQKSRRKTQAEIAAAVTACLGEPTTIDLLSITSLAPAGTPAVRPADRPAGTASGNEVISHSVATCGFPVTADNRASRLAMFGPSKYTVAAVLEAFRVKAQSYEITIDGVTQQVEATILALGNTASFGNGYYIAPNADPTDGLIDLTIVGDVGTGTLLRLMPATKAGKQVEHPLVQQLRGKEIELRLAEQSPTGAGNAADSRAGNNTDNGASGVEGAEMRADGELAGWLPLRVKVMTGALRVANK